MKKLAWIVPMVGLLAGCGDGGALRASGSVRLTVHQAGQADGTAEFLPPGDVAIDPPPGVGQGVYGTCRKTATGWSVTLTRADAATVGLRAFSATVPISAGNANATTSLSFTLGESVYTGTATCQATATGLEDEGVRLEARCTGLQSTGDPRTVDAVVSLSLWNCSSS